MSIFSLSAPPFDSCASKLNRAREHMKVLKDEVDAWREKKPYTLVRQRDADATRHSVIVRVKTSPPLERWQCIAADCFHNFRAVLDQLIYAVAVFQTKLNPPTDERLLQFPICDMPDAFADRREQRRIRSLSGPVRTAIERMQPYKRLHPDLPPLLSLLRDFDDTDKHRLLKVAFAQVVEGKFIHLSGIPRGQIPKFVFHSGSLEDGTEIAAIAFDRPAPDVRYQDYRAKACIAVSHAPTPRGNDRVDLIDLVRWVSAEVDAVRVGIFNAL